MSIDPSLRSTGIYIYRPGIYDFSFTIKTSKKDNIKESYNKINSSLKTLILSFNVRIVFLEDYAYKEFGRVSSISKIAEVKGIILNAIYDQESGVEKLFLIPISTWKSILNNLKLPKRKNKQYINTVNQKYNRNFKTCDEVDAFLMFTAMNLLNQGVTKTNKQLKLKEEMYGIWD
jgi:Holliday junction resolvasome RuvABC endonuclease subunit